MEVIQHLETSRLIIRPFKQKDLDQFIQFMTNSRATKYLMFSDSQKTRKGAVELFNMVLESYGNGETIHSYAIGLKNDQFIGSCGFSLIKKTPLTVEIYYSLLPEYWKKGYATEATRKLIKYCFHHLHVHEINAYMSPQNPDSEGIAINVGMRYEGIKKHPLFQVEGKKYTIKFND